MHRVCSLSQGWKAGLFVLLISLLAACAGGTAPTSVTPSAEPEQPSPPQTSVGAPAATPDANAQAQVQLVGPTWQWVEFQDMAGKNNITLSAPGRYTLRFQPDGTLEVHADCNIAGARYVLKGSQLSIQIETVTEVNCGTDSLSEQFLTDLGFVATYILHEGRLALNLQMDGGNMLFVPADS